MTKIITLLLLLILIPAVLGGKKGKRFGWGKKIGKKWRGGKKKGAKKRLRKSESKAFSGIINVVEPKFDTVNDAYENLLGLKLITTGTCDLLGDFTASFFFTPFKGADPFDGTVAIEDAAGNILNAAFFNAAIQFPTEGETDLLIPIDAHIIGGSGLYENYRGKLKLAGRITPKEGGKFGPTRFDMTGEMSKVSKKERNKHLKLLGLPKSIPLDGSAEFPNASTALTKLSIREMKDDPEAAIEPESSTEPYAGDDEKVENSPEEEEKAVVSKLEGYGKLGKLGRMKLSMVLDSFQVGQAFDGTLMMKMMDKGTEEESEHALKAQFSRAMMMPTAEGDYHFVVPATIIGGYGGYLEAKGAVLLDGKVKRDREGNLGEARFEIEGDIITEAIVDEYEERGHQEQLRGGRRV